MYSGNPVPFSHDDFVFQAGEISGDIDSTFTITMTFIEGDDATVTEGSNGIQEQLPSAYSSSYAAS